MGIAEILASLDREIALLRQARALLAGAPRRGAGRAAAVKPAKPARKARRKKRKLSPEGRRRIAEAVKRRWEQYRKAAAK